MLLLVVHQLTPGYETLFANKHIQYVWEEEQSEHVQSNVKKQGDKAKQRRSDV